MENDEIKLKVSTELLGIGSRLGNATDENGKRNGRRVKTNIKTDAPRSRR